MGLIGPSVTDAARELGVTRQSLYRWMEGEIPNKRLDELAARVGTLTIRIGENEEAAWPEWAKRLDEKMDLLLSGAALADALHEALRTASPPAGDEDPPSDQDSPASGQGQRRGR